eukprot:CAMPEP_0119014264 /NCGR_PEP_ID=MMETSP1176-20130426/9442_1 /TAXON_ID=265551 /ORGANISM="Synedropsis recta cf, Strain CCMP1620" /LENGTH=188 /DNA_ID=CAMNT_0006967419 /DNA_START=186 /DNA_END=753 /DNA_ORIENTATION=+
MTASADVSNTTSPVPLLPSFSSIVRTPTKNLALKPSPRSHLSYTGSTSTPTFVDEASFDDDFFLLSPDELTSSDNLTCASSSPRRRLLPRPRSNDLNHGVVLKESASLMLDNFPVKSFKRPREGGFLLPRRTRAFDPSFLNETTGSTYFPEAVMGAIPQTAAETMPRNDTKLCIPTTPGHNNTAASRI